MSDAVRRRSRWGSVRGWPVLSSHLSPGLAPQVAQDTANTRLCVIFMTVLIPRFSDGRCSIWDSFTKMEGGCEIFVRLIYIAEGARARPARIAARSAGACPSACRRRSRRTLCRDCKNGELGFQLGGMALRTLGLLLAVDQSLELVMTFFADVFEDRHGRLQNLLESICDDFATSRLPDSSGSSGFSGPQF